MNENCSLALATSPPFWIKRSDLKPIRLISTLAISLFLVLVGLPTPSFAENGPAPAITITNINNHRGATVSRDLIEVSLTINSPTLIDEWSLQLISRNKTFGSRSELGVFAASNRTDGSVLATKIGTEPLLAQTAYSVSISITGEKAFVRDLGVHGFWLQLITNRTVAKTIPFFSYGSGGSAIKPTPITWILPLAEPPHRDLRGNFIDDDLVKSLAPDGRLGRILNFGNGPLITWLIDPYLVETVEAMTHGYTFGQQKTGAGQAIAIAWLAQLRAVAANSRVIALPYGDPDLVTLAHAGLKSEFTKAISEGAVRLSALLAMPIARTAAWPFNGLINRQTQTLVRSSGATSLLLNSDSMLSTQTATGSSVTNTREPTNELIYDAILSKQLNNLTPLSANRAAAELTMITAERPAIARSQLILPPRLWNPNTESILTLTSGAPIKEVSISDLESTAVVGQSTTKFSAPEPLSEGEELALTKIRKNLAIFSQVSPVGSSFPQAELLASTLLLSSSWHGLGLKAFLYSQHAQTSSEQIVRQVRVLSGQYTLTSLHQKLPITIANDSTEPATVILRLVPTTYRVLRPEQIQLTLEPQSKTQVMVPIDAVTSGDLALSATVLTPHGEILGDVSELSLKIRTVPAIATWIMEGAGIVLILAAGAQIFRRLRRIGAIDSDDANSTVGQ